MQPGSTLGLRVNSSAMARGFPSASSLIPSPQLHLGPSTSQLHPSSSPSQLRTRLPHHRHGLPGCLLHFSPPPRGSFGLLHPSGFTGVLVHTGIISVHRPQAAPWLFLTWTPPLAPCPSMLPGILLHRTLPGTLPAYPPSVNLKFQLCTTPSFGSTVGHLPPGCLLLFSELMLAICSSVDSFIIHSSMGASTVYSTLVSPTDITAYSDPGLHQIFVQLQSPILPPRSRTVLVFSSFSYSVIVWY